MDTYRFNVSVYRCDTAHLSPIEHYIYRSLIDTYYLQESPITNDVNKITRRLGLDSDSVQLVMDVLDDFFVLTDDGWAHSRIDDDLGV